MNIDRPQLKSDAREIIRTSNPKVIYASLMFIALTALISFLSARLTGINYEELMRLQRYLEAGDTEHALSYIGSLAPSSGARLIDYALQFATLIVEVGFTVFLFRTVRRLGAVYGNLLDGFGPYFRVALLQLVTGIFVGLWSLLFIIPGIVAAYRYSMAPYIMLDHPDYSIMDCIRASKQMTKGYKGQLFMLDLSFLGYILLSLIPILGFIVRVWYVPYHDTSYILYYDAIRARTEAIPSDY